MSTDCCTKNHDIPASTPDRDEYYLLGDKGRLLLTRTLDKDWDVTNTTSVCVHMPVCKHICVFCFYPMVGLFKKQVASGGTRPGTRPPSDISYKLLYVSACFVGSAFSRTRWNQVEPGQEPGKMLDLLPFY